MSVQDAKVTPAPPKVPPHEATYLTSPGERGIGGGRTFQYEASLPSLPLPSLQDTLDLYLNSVIPHLSEEEYQVTKAEVDRFATGVGPVLQRRLQLRQAQKRNWLEDWWLHHAYLSYREPLLPTLNTSGHFSLDSSLWKPSTETAFEQGALNLWSMLHFFQILREERFKPQANREGKPLSMEQYRWVFNCTRIPGQKVDSLRCCWKTKEEGDCPLHIVVLCKGHIWIMYPFDAQDQPLTPPELEVQIRQVWDKCEALGPGAGVAALTCDKRDTWAENRDWLKSLTLANMHNLDLVETAAFVFVLDDGCPANREELVWEGLCGDVTNRWADKSMSYIMMRNGYIVSNNDHTPFDAMVTLILAHYQYLLLTHMESRWDGVPGVRTGLTSPKLLKFDIDGKLMEAISEAKETSRAYTSNISARPFSFTEYGRDFLRPHRLHPDSYIQMALQLAYLRLHGRPAPTYETASTRQFYHGRTETIRSCTPEAVCWAQAMLDPHATVSERRQKLLTAIARHNDLRERCEGNQGVDRHLMGLYLMALEEGDEVPGIFTDSAFFKSGGGGNYALSTSTIGYTSMFGGVAAMTPDGYGCFYSMVSDRFNFFVSHYISSQESDGAAFCAALTDSLREMRLLFVAPRAAL